MRLTLLGGPWLAAGNPVAWQAGKWLPDGRARVYVLLAADQQRLVAAFGQAWLDAYLSETQAALDKWGVH